MNPIDKWLLRLSLKTISPEEAERHKKKVWDKWDKINKEKIRKENLVSYGHDMKKDPLLRSLDDRISELNEKD